MISQNRHYSLKPIKRSRFRITLGKLYYRLNRYYEWCFGDKKYAKHVCTKALDYTIYTHQTPIYRRLKSVDQWLQVNKAHNLSLAIKHINNITIRPQETFSYWKLIGYPSKYRGYKKGMNLFYGGFKPGYGGGLCQLSNLLFWLFLHSELDITERHRHSFDVFPDVNRTQPFGSGATCVYNYRDLQVRNNTNNTYQLRLGIDSGFLKGEILSSASISKRIEIVEEDHKIIQANWGQYIRHNKIYKEFYDANSELIGRHLVCENNALMMYSPLIPEIHVVNIGNSRTIS